MITLESIITLEYGESLTEEARRPGEVPVYGSNGIVGKHDRAITDGPTIVVGRKGSVGKVHYSPIPCYPIDTAYYVRVRPGKQLNAVWLSLSLRSLGLERLVTATGVPGLNRDDVYALEIPLPPLAEQERIAARLTEQLAVVESARAAAQARLVAAEALPAAYLREAFGLAAPFSAAPTRPTEPTHTGWRWHLLTDIARLATGHTPSRNEPSWWGGEIQWLQLPDIRAVDGRRVTKTLEQTNALGIANSSSVILPAGTVCMSRTASVGFVTIMSCDMATSQDFVNWVCGPDLDPDFLMYLILRCRKEIRDLGSGATHHSIYFETVRNFSVCVPDIADQRRIAADLALRLAEAERLTAIVRDELTTIEALPAALLRDAFNGHS